MERVGAQPIQEVFLDDKMALVDRMYEIAFVDQPIAIGMQAPFGVVVSGARLIRGLLLRVFKVLNGFARDGDGFPAVIEAEQDELQAQLAEERGLLAELIEIHVRGRLNPRRRTGRVSDPEIVHHEPLPICGITRCRTREELRVVCDTLQQSVIVPMRRAVSAQRRAHEQKRVLCRWRPRADAGHIDGARILRHDFHRSRRAAQPSVDFAGEHFAGRRAGGIDGGNRRTIDVDQHSSGLRHAIVQHPIEEDV